MRATEGHRPKTAPVQDLATSRNQATDNTGNTDKIDDLGHGSDVRLTHQDAKVTRSSQCAYVHFFPAWH